MDRSIAYPFTATGALAGFTEPLPCVISGLSWRSTTASTITITEGISGKVLAEFNVPALTTNPAVELPGVLCGAIPYVTVSTGTGSGAVYICPQP